MFYPAGADELRRDIDTLLGSTDAPPGPAPKSPPKSPPKSLIVPHAGYVYSGPIAATAYRSLRPASRDISRVVLFGPAHRVYLEGMAVPATDGFATPLGTVPIDRSTVEKISRLPGTRTSDEAHRDEHSLEVQLPFLQTVLEAFELVPVVVGRCDPTLLADVIDTVWGGPETLLVVSSDLSHYLPYERARQIDARTCRRIIDKQTTLTGDEACGAHAINGLMSSRGCRNLTVEAIDVRNSGDTAGDKSRVVGYGAFTLH